MFTADTHKIVPTCWSASFWKIILRLVDFTSNYNFMIFIYFWTVKEIHFICIKIFKGLYKLGILKKETYIERWNVNSQLNIIYSSFNFRHRAEIGECLAAFSSSFPLPFLESKLTFGHDASYSLPGFFQLHLHFI